MPWNTITKSELVFLSCLPQDTQQYRCMSDVCLYVVQINATNKIDLSSNKLLYPWLKITDIWNK